MCGVWGSAEVLELSHLTGEKRCEFLCQPLCLRPVYVAAARTMGSCLCLWPLEAICTLSLRKLEMGGGDRSDRGDAVVSQTQSFRCSRDMALHAHTPSPSLPTCSPCVPVGLLSRQEVELLVLTPESLCFVERGVEACANK